MGDLSGMSTFVVRLAWEESGRLGGVVERVQSGEKIRVDAIADIGQAIAQMVQKDRNPWRPPSERNPKTNARTDSLSVGAEESLHEDP